MDKWGTWSTVIVILFLMLIIMTSLWIASSKASHWRACDSICEENEMRLEGMTPTGCACSPSPGIRYYFEV